jgi:hypothetical protein
MSFFRVPKIERDLEVARRVMLRNLRTPAGRNLAAHVEEYLVAVDRDMAASSPVIQHSWYDVVSDAQHMCQQSWEYVELEALLAVALVACSETLQRFGRTDGFSNGTRPYPHTLLTINGYLNITIYATEVAEVMEAPFIGDSTRTLLSEGAIEETKPSTSVASAASTSTPTPAPQSIPPAIPRQHQAGRGLHWSMRG